MLDLWDMAQSANFTEKELEAFRVGAASLPADSLRTWGRSSSLVLADQRFTGTFSPCRLCPSAAPGGGPCGTKLASSEHSVASGHLLSSGCTGHELGLVR